MKYTDYFLKFPVRIYDIISLQETALEEQEHFEKTKGVINKPVNFMVGDKFLRPSDIKTYGDYYGNEVNFNLASLEGFNFCLIETYQGDSYECNWKTEEFEAALNAHIEKFPASIALNKNNIQA